MPTEREILLQKYLKDKKSTPVEPRFEPMDAAKSTGGVSVGTAGMWGNAAAAVAQAASEVLNNVAAEKDALRARQFDERMNQMRYGSRVRDAKYGGQRQQGRDNAEDYIRTLSSILRAQPT